ncbi:unnamed protein product [Thelazia callipaeda]|uniref:Zyxin n=1 Tax=Thelazia callipaeda TaxID=103827 RepID=A0A0N5CY98_THECL|nr:unnamed protein product [Thelazia callipaeda]
MTDVELETRNFLRELDTFGQPPPPQRLVSDADSRTLSKEFELKLHLINLEKQKHLRNGTTNPKAGTSFSHVVTDAANKSDKLRIPARSNTNNDMSKDEIIKLKEQVLSASRPLNPWYDHQHQSPNTSRLYARNTFAKYYQNDKPSTTQAPASFSLHGRENSSQYHPINVATVSGDNTIFSVINAKKSNRGENAASLSPASAYSNTETSHSPISTSASSMANSLDPSEDTHQTMQFTTKDFRFLIPPAKTYYHSGPPISRPLQFVAANQRFISSFESKNPSANVIPPWRNKSVDSVASADSGISSQRKKYDEITNNLEKQLNLSRKPIGLCEICQKAVIEESDATCALGQLYHQNCFTCDICGRTLKGKKFYKTQNNKYCEEDYLYRGIHETSQRCAACSHFIIDMVLQALGKSYHPRCFRCKVCRTCLNGIPFAVDSENNVYCSDDYHKLFAPKCSACRQTIMPNKESGETIRVVALNRSYHIECYSCEGCGMQLTDEPEKRCYPLNDHLLCKNCHMHWLRTGGDEKLITDL